MKIIAFGSLVNVLCQEIMCGMLMYVETALLTACMREADGSRKQSCALHHHMLILNASNHGRPLIIY